VIVAIAVAVVAIGISGGVAMARSGSSGPSYRLATVTRGSVTETVTSVGTVSSVNRATVTFPISGKVASVGVKIGSPVSAGQTLAQLDTTSLAQQVASAQATVAKAQQTLAADTEAQLTGTTSSAGSNSGGGVTTSAYTTNGGAHVVLAAAVQPAVAVEAAAPTTPADVAQALAVVEQDQTAVTSAQQAVDTLLTTLAADIQAQSTACQPLTATAPGGPSLAKQQALCQTAITTAVNDQSGVPAAKTALGDAEATLTKDLGTLQAAVANLGTSPSAPPSSTPTPTPSPTPSHSSPSPHPSGSPTRGGTHPSGAPTSGAHSGGSGSFSRGGRSGSASGSSGSGAAGSFGSSGSRSGTGSSGRSGSGSGSSGSGSSGSASSGGSGSGSSGSSGRAITAEQLAADQAQIDLAQADLAVAQQNAGQATLTSPISGTVAAVGLSAGSSAGSSGITVIGPGSREVSTTVTLADVDQVKVGDSVAVTADGGSGALPGKVTAIGLLNTTTGTSTSYPVTVLLDPTTARLYDGLGASVVITTSAVSNVLTVPSSAVRTLGSFHSVTVLKNGTTSTARVTVGAVGPDLTEIDSGLTAGQRVVLADLDEPLPTSNTNARRFGVTGGTGGLGGAGTGIGGTTGAGGTRGG
jgi:trimeric autotransporter adhesin